MVLNRLSRVLNRLSMQLDRWSSELNRLSMELNRPRAAEETPSAGNELTEGRPYARSGRSAFAVGTGKCGTHFLVELLKWEPDVAASHEREPRLQTFHRYCKWYNLPVDNEGYLQAMETRIADDLKNHSLSFEASSHLSLSIRELHERFSAKIILLVRHPRDVVRSYLKKGWYAEPIVQDRRDLALGYQDYGRFHHFLGRIVPRGDELDSWNELTQVGKLAWYWSRLNQAVLEEGQRLPSERWRLYRLETFDFEQYQEFSDFLGFRPQLRESEFNRIRTSRPGGKNPPSATRWSPAEWEQFRTYAGPLAEQLGYELSEAD